MLIRIVRLPLAESHVPEFLRLFDESKGHIRSFDGCEALELLCDRMDRHVLFTYSLWRSHGHLERYLQSGLFKATWKKVRPLFSGKPQAWSLEKLRSVEPPAS